MAGGTGGHFFPALALAEAIAETGKSDEIILVGRRGGPEALWAARAGVEFTSVSAGSPLAGPVLKRGRGIARTVMGLMQAVAVFARYKPHVVVGFGGYVSVPCVLAAALLRCPVVLHEQNVIPGKATRLLAPLARAVAVSYPDSIPRLGRVRTVVTGTPVRRSVIAVDDRAGADKLGLARGSRTLLIVGGSQGAHGLNCMMARAVGSLAPHLAGWQVLHISGEVDRDMLRSAYEETGIDARVVSFVHSMGIAYSSASLAVCRAGASGVAELTTCGVPGIYVPYPGAGMHQEANARHVAGGGGGIVLKEEEAGGEGLGAAIARLVRDEEQLRKMAGCARGMGHGDAAGRLAELVIEAGDERRQAGGKVAARCR